MCSANCWNTPPAEAVNFSEIGENIIRNMIIANINNNNLFIIYINLYKKYIQLIIWKY